MNYIFGEEIRLITLQIDFIPWWKRGRNKAKPLANFLSLLCLSNKEKLHICKKLIMTTDIKKQE